MARRDRARTAVQTTPSNIDVPGVRWSIPLGGAPSQWMVRDVDLDGQPEVVLIRGGRAVARRFDGTLIWASAPLGLDRVTFVGDLDDDGRPEVYAESRFLGLSVLDGSTGRVLWSPAWEPDQRLGDVWPVPGTGGDRQLLYVAHRDNLGGGGARIFDVTAGVGAARLVSELDVSEHGYWRGVHQDAGDIDGDGVAELVTLSDDRIIAYDAFTGRVAWRSASIGRFPSGTAVTTVVDLDGDGRAEIVLASNQPPPATTVGRRILVAGLEGGELRVRWSHVFDPDDGIHHFVRRPAADVVPGGGVEIVTSAYEPGIGWRVVVWPADARGDEPPLLTLADRRLLALADLTGDGQSEIITMDARGPSGGAFGTLRALRVRAAAPGGIDELWRRDDAQLPLEPLDWQRSDGPVVVGDDGAGVLVFEDVDGDGRGDGLQVAGARRETRRRFAAGVYAGSARGVFAPTDSLLAVVRTDGFVELLDSHLSVLNAREDGRSALRETAHLAPGAVVGGGGEGRLLVTIDGSPSLTGYSFPADGSEPRLMWRRPEQIPSSRGLSPTFTWLDDASGTVAFHARKSLGGLDLVVVDGTSGAQLRAIEIGATSSSEPLNAAYPLGVGLGPVASLLQATYDNHTRWITYQRVDLLSEIATTLELSRRLSSGMDSPPTQFDFQADGTPEILITQGRQLTVARADTGALQASRPVASPGGLSTAVDLDGRGSTALVYGAEGGLEGLTDQLDRVWQVESAARQTLPALLPLVGGTGRIAVVNVGEPVYSILDGRDGGLLERSALAGGRRYRDAADAVAAGVSAGILTAPSAIVDLDGAGTAAFLFGSTDGHLYAVSAADGDLIWGLNLRSGVGGPLMADLDGDGISEVLVPTGDGFLNVIGAADLSAPDAVYDTDGTYVATSGAEDLDIIVSSSTVGANWTTVTGATHYSYQLIRDDDLVVVPWTDVGASTRFSRTDLSLQRGHLYFSLVRAHDRSGRLPRISTEAVSDGFIVDDDAPPFVALEAHPAVIWSTEGSGRSTASDATATFRDAVGLASYRLYVSTDDGRQILDLAHALTGGREQHITRSWAGIDAEGRPVTPASYLLVAEAFDANGYRGHAEARVFVCGPGTEHLTACMPDRSDEPMRRLGGPWQVEGGCGCRLVRGSADPPVAACLAIVAVLWVRRRRRRTLTTFHRASMLACMERGETR